MSDELNERFSKAARLEGGANPTRPPIGPIWAAGRRRRLRRVAGVSVAAVVLLAGIAAVAIGRGGDGSDGQKVAAGPELSSVCELFRTPIPPADMDSLVAVGVSARAESTYTVADLFTRTFRNVLKIYLAPSTTAEEIGLLEQEFWRQAGPNAQIKVVTQAESFEELQHLFANFPGMASGELVPAEELPPRLEITKASAEEFQRWASWGRALPSVFEVVTPDRDRFYSVVLAFRSDAQRSVWARTATELGAESSDWAREAGAAIDGLLADTESLIHADPALLLGDGPTGDLGWNPDVIKQLTNNDHLARITEGIAALPDDCGGLTPKTSTTTTSTASTTTTTPDAPVVTGVKNPACPGPVPPVYGEVSPTSARPGSPVEQAYPANAVEPPERAGTSLVAGRDLADSAGRFALDSDGDGKADVVEHVGEIEMVTVRFTRGDGVLEIAFEGHQISSSDVNDIVGDIDGDGRDEISVSASPISTTSNSQERLFIVPGTTPVGSYQLDEVGIEMPVTLTGISNVGDQVEGPENDLWVPMPNPEPPVMSWIVSGAAVLAPGPGGRLASWPAEEVRAGIALATADLDDGPPAVITTDLTMLRVWLGETVVQLEVPTDPQLDLMGPAVDVYRDSAGDVLLSAGSSNRGGNVRYYWNLTQSCGIEG